MLIIGELINSTRKQVKEALQNKDEVTIRRLAREQVEAGADVLDINTATSMKREIDDLEWVIGLIYDEVGEGVRLSIDSPNPEAIAAGLALCKARPMINSINNDPKLKERLIPLIKEYEADVIGLTMSGKGMPKTVKERLAEAERLVTTLQSSGIDLSRLFIDPLVMTIGSNQEQARVVIETVRAIKERWGAQGVKTSVGLSNVSYGLPSRSIINQAFLAMLLEAGLDAALIDPTNRGMMDILKASEALIGTDAHCLGYLRYIRGKAKAKEV
jgi:5-methyltetrahydrofolate--homocysteine methyltransferase